MLNNGQHRASTVAKLRAGIYESGKLPGKMPAEPKPHLEWDRSRQKWMCEGVRNGWWLCESGYTVEQAYTTWAKRLDALK